MRVGAAAAPEILRFFHIGQKLLFWCSQRDGRDSCNCLWLLYFHMLLSLLLYASIYGTPSGNVSVKPAERLCARTGRALQLFVGGFLFLPWYITLLVQQPEWFLLKKEEKQYELKWHGSNWNSEQKLRKWGALNYLFLLMSHNNTYFIFWPHLSIVLYFVFSNASMMSNMDERD